MNSNVEERKLNTNIVTDFDHVATSSSQLVAYDEMGAVTTYGELKVASDSLANWLDQQSLPSHSPILAFGDHQVEMVAGFIAALKTGHAYIPVAADSALPRIQSILDTGKPSLILAIDDFPGDQLKVDAPIVTRDQVKNVIAKRESLKDLIMPYMMPTHFDYWESFPMSANGKIAVKQLIKEANE